MADIRQAHTPTALTGGTAGCLDAIAAVTIADGSLAFTSDSSGAFHVHKYNVNGTAATNSPTVIRPLDYATSGNWENQISPFGTQMPDTTTIGPYGGVFGGDITKTGANELTVTPVSCLDHTLKIKLYKADNTVVAIPAVANTIYHLAVVRLLSGAITVKAYLSEAAMAADVTINAYRWIGEWLTNGAAACVEGACADGIMTRSKASECVISTGITTTYATVDHSAQITPSRVAAIEYGCRDSITAFLYASTDGVNLAGLVGYCNNNLSDTDTNAWGSNAYGSTNRFPFSSAMKFKSESGTIDLLVRTIEYRR